MAEKEREEALNLYKRRLLEKKQLQANIDGLRQTVQDTRKKFDKSENDLKALQSVGQIIGEVLNQLTDEKFIVKASSGPRYVVGCRNKVDKNKINFRNKSCSRYDNFNYNENSSKRSWSNSFSHGFWRSWQSRI